MLIDPRRAIAAMGVMLLAGCGQVADPLEPTRNAIAVSIRTALRGQPIEVVSVDWVSKALDKPAKYLAYVKVREIGQGTRLIESDIVRLCGEPDPKCWYVTFVGERYRGYENSVTKEWHSSPDQVFFRAADKQANSGDFHAN